MTTNTTDTTKSKTPKRTPRKAKGPKNRNGAGSVHQRTDGRWEATVWVPTSSGEMKLQRFYHRDRDVVEAQVTELKALVLNGYKTPEKNVRVKDYLDWWLATIVKPKVKPWTYVSYESAVRLYLIPGLGNMWLHQLRAADIRAFLERVKQTCQCCAQGKDAARKDPDNRPPDPRRKHPRRDVKRCCALDPVECCGQFPSDSRIRGLHRILRAALQDAVEDELLTRNVARHVHPATTKAKTPTPFNPAEAAQFLDTARGTRWHALFALAINLGPRRGEILALKWDDVDLDTGVIHIRASMQRIPKKGLWIDEPKTLSSHRSITAPPPLVEILKVHRLQQEFDRSDAGELWQETGHVFTTRIGTPIEPRNLNRTFHNLCDKAEVRRIRFHDLRHTCASLLHAAGVPLAVIAAILGHSSSQITDDIYVDIFPTEQHNALNALSYLHRG